MTLLRTFIKNYLYESAITISNLSEKTGLIFSTNEFIVQMILIDLEKLENNLSLIQATKKEEELTNLIDQFLIAGITASKEDVWRVNSVYAKNGFGPLIYRLAMQYVTSLGSSLGPNMNTVSGAAKNIWMKFQHQPDVKQHPTTKMKADLHLAFSLEGNDYQKLVDNYSSLKLSKETHDLIFTHVLNYVRFKARV